MGEKVNLNYTHVLKGSELRQAILSPNAEALALGGEVDFEQSRVLVYTADGRKRSIPFDFFRCRMHGPVPDFQSFEVADCGNKIRFGAYETSVDTILDFLPHFS